MNPVVRNSFVCGRWQDNAPPDDATLMIADPVYGSEDVPSLVTLAVERRLPAAIFMWPDDVWGFLPSRNNSCTGSSRSPRRTRRSGTAGLSR